MKKKQTHRAIPGSARQHRRDDRLLGKLRAKGKHGVRVSVYLRPRSSREDAKPAPPAQGEHRTHEQFEAIHGAHPEDMQRVIEFAEHYELQVIERDLLKRRVKLEGSPAQIEKAFNVELFSVERGKVRHHAHEGPVHVPESLHGIVTSVFGLDTRPIARKQTPAAQAPKTSKMPQGSYLTPIQAGQAYSFPAHLDGRGQCVGLVQLAGGYHESDLRTYFARLGVDFDMRTQLAVHGENRPSDSFDGDGRYDMEVTMDLELAASLAPAAKFVTYFAEDRSRQARSFIDTVSDAVHDRKHAPSVVSISWASWETDWTEAEAREMAQLIELASEELGVTVCVSSGDYGAWEEKPSKGGGGDSRHIDWDDASGDADPRHIDWDDASGEEAGRVGVTFPGSAPHALACGGTTLDAPDGRYEKETAWKSGLSTGGVSKFFKRPAYQKHAGVPPAPKEGHRPGFRGRGVPDVAGNAEMYDPGYLVLVHGFWAPDPANPFGSFGGGGTSAAAPVWAALVARLNQGLSRRLGFLGPRLYALMGSSAFHPITEGDNGYYRAGPGWNACTGLGSPNGTELLEHLE